MTAPEGLRPPYYHPYRIGECKIEHGDGAVDKIVAELEYLEKERALVICGPNAANARTIERVKRSLGPAVVGVYDKCRLQAPLDTVYEVAEIVKEKGIDVLVTIGGGSTSDTAKGVACTLGEGKPLEKLHSRFVPPDKYEENYMKKPKMPIIAVSTMFGGAEMAPGFGNKTAAGNKIAYRGDYVTARVVILDPSTTLDVNLTSLCQSTFNGLAHGIEGLYSRSRTPISDGLCKESVRLFTANMPLLVERPDDLDVRMKLQWAATMGGIIVTNARVGIQHGASHCIGAALNLSHGLANALTLPYGMEFNLDVAEPQLADAGRVMGVAGDSVSDRFAARAAIERIRELQQALGIPGRLSEVPEVAEAGRKRDEVAEQVAELTQRNRSHLFNPKAFGPEDVRELVQRMW